MKEWQRHQEQADQAHELQLEAHDMRLHMLSHMSVFGDDESNNTYRTICRLNHLIEDQVREYARHMDLSASLWEQAA
jgi:hypothetical protein